jgi:sugar phosphate isomerase/epimerase
MRVGIDSYAYHRLYGETRPGEIRVPDPWAPEPEPAIAHARSLDVEFLLLETCFLPDPDACTDAIATAAAPVQLGFAWGHPWPAGRLHGLDGGRRPGAEADLARWIDAAARLGHPMLRITAGSPASRGTEPVEDLLARLVGPVRRAADRAAAAGISLALESHGDLRAPEVLELLERVNRPSLGVCIDTLNLVVVGDDMVEGCRALAPHALLVKLKDHRPGDPTGWGGPVCTALGQGIAPLAEVLEVLGRAGFDGPVCAGLASLGDGPVDEVAMIDASVAWLRENLPA